MTSIFFVSLKNYLTSITLILVTLNERKIPVKWEYLTEKIEIQKNEKTPGYLSKEHVCQISDPYVNL